MILHISKTLDTFEVLAGTDAEDSGKINMVRGDLMEYH